MINVLFVCLGNICRSPMAEGIFNDKIKRLGLTDQIRSDSAGTGDYHIGSQPDPRTIETLEKNNIQHRHAARQAISEDANEYDYILAMDSTNYQDLLFIFDMEVDGLLLMRHFDSTNVDSDVPDPYFGGIDGFDQVFKILDRSIDAFIKHIREKHGI